MEKSKKKVPVNVMTKATLAALMLGSTIGSNYVHAAETPENTPKASGENKSATMPLDVDNSKINEAVKQAKGAGVEVKQDQTKHRTVSVNDADKAEKEIQADYEAQIKEIEAKTKAANAAHIKYNSDKNAYDKKKKDYDAANTKYKADLDTYNKQKEQYDKDKKDYDAKVAQYKKDKADYDKKLAEYKTAKAEFDKKAAQYAKDNDAYKTALADYNKKLKAYNKEKADYDAAVKKNAADNAKYQADLKAWKAKVEQIKKQNDAAKAAYTSKVNKEKDAVKSANNNPVQPKYSQGAGNKYTASGSWTNLKGKTLNGGDIHVAGTGNVDGLDDLQNGKFNIHAYSDSNKLKNSNIVQKVSWGNYAPKGASSLVKGDKVTEDARNKVPGYVSDIYNTSGERNQFGKTTQLWSVKAGQWVTIPNAVHLANGKTKDLKVKFDKSGTDLRYGGDWVVFWNEGNSINYYDGSADLADAPPKDKISATYQVDDGTNGKTKYLWTGAVVDIDGGQQLTMEGDNYAILGIGGGLKANSNTVKSIKSDDDLGKTWGKNASSNFLDGTSSIPDGTIVFARYDSEISHTLGNTGVQRSTLVANGDFGISVKTNVADYPVLKKNPPKPTPPTGTPKEPVKPTPPKAPDKVGTPPVEPKAPTPPGAEPKEPVKPTPPKGPGNPPAEPGKVSVNYHLNTLSVTPTNHKDVEKGVQKEDTKATINGQKVEVGDELTYPLTNSDLPAHRSDDIKSYVIKDKVPEGVTPNKSEIDKVVDKSKWDVKVNGQEVTFTATKDLLASMNKDKSKAFKVPVAPLVVTVTKGGDANLDNTFDTIINDQTVKSNKVTNTPPKLVKKQAKKTVSTDKIVDFNEKYQYGLDFTIPNDKNYKKLEIKDSDMTKGSLDFDKVVVKQGDKDITDQGTLELDKDKDTFTWTAKNPTSLLGKTVHVDIDAKVKQGTDLSKYKTNEKDSDGNVIYSMPNTGHLVMDGEDTPTNEVPIRVKEIPGSIKKSIVEDDKLVESNKEKFGSDILYNLDVQFANNEKGDDVYVKDQLEKEVLDIQKDNVHVYTNDDIKSNTSETDKAESNKDEAETTDKSSDEKATSDVKSDEKDMTKESNDTSKEDVKQQAGTTSKDKTLKTGKYEVGKDIDAGKYTATNNDPSDALVVTKDKNGETVTNETIKPNASKDVELKDGEELSVTAGDKDVTFKSQATDDKSDSNAIADNKDDSKATDSKDTNKSDDAKDESKADDNEKSEDTSKKSTETNGQAPNVKDMKEVTDQGTLSVDEEGESFVWTPKDPSAFKGKKVVVQVGAKFKEDKNGNYKKYEKDGKYIVPNVAEMASGDKDKAKKSNEVHSELEKPKEETPAKPEQPKETPKEQPKEQPSNPETPQPQKSQPKTVLQQQNLPSTGSNAVDGGIGAAIAAAFAGAVGYLFNRNRKKQQEQDNTNE